jgi:hypothetical protein
MRVFLEGAGLGLVKKNDLGTIIEKITKNMHCQSGKCDPNSDKCAAGTYGGSPFDFCALNEKAPELCATNQATNPPSFLFCDLWDYVIPIGILLLVLWHFNGQQ